MILLDHHKSAKREIIARFQQLAEVADGVGMVTLARDIRTTRIPKLEAERFHLVVLGEFNHGKSTFVNAMLGDDILPTGITPTTASISGGDRSGATLRKIGGRVSASSRAANTAPSSASSALSSCSARRPGVLGDDMLIVR